MAPLRARSFNVVSTAIFIVSKIVMFVMVLCVALLQLQACWVNGPLSMIKHMCMGLQYVNIFNIILMLRYLLKGKGFYRFCQGRQTDNYPYLFGGLPLNQYRSKQAQEDQYVSKIIFGDNITQEFCQAYKAYVEGLRDKDYEFLKSIASKQLANNAKLVDVKLLNQNSKIDISIGVQKIVIGAGFDRQLHGSQWKPFMSNKQSDFFQVYRTDNIGLTIPVLFIAGVYFKSKMRLIPTPQNLNGDNTVNQEQKEQVHMVQFQYQRSQYNILSIYKIAMKSAWRKLSEKNIDFAQAIIRDIFEVGKHQWKIADVDKVLKGNLPGLPPSEK